MHLLMVEGVWTMQQNWAGLIDVLLLRLLLLLLMVVGGQLLSVMMLVLMHGLMGRHGVVVWRLGAQGAVHCASLSYLHPKLDLRRGERVSLLAERLTRAHEGPGLVRGAALVQVNHPLVALVGRRGSWGFSWKES